MRGRHSIALLKFGTGELDKTLIAGNLLDELHLWVFPVIAGSGERLMDGLIDTRTSIWPTPTRWTMGSWYTYSRQKMPTSPQMGEGPLRLSPSRRMPGASRSGQRGQRRPLKVRVLRRATPSGSS